MFTPEEIKRAILQLAPIDRESMAHWFGNNTEHFVAEPAVAYGADDLLLARPTWNNPG